MTNYNNTNINEEEMNEEEMNNFYQEQHSDELFVVVVKTIIGNISTTIFDSLDKAEEAAEFFIQLGSTDANIRWERLSTGDDKELIIDSYRSSFKLENEDKWRNDFRGQEVWIEVRVINSYHF